MRAAVVAKLPHIWNQAQHFAGAVIHHVADGLVNVSDSEQQERMKVCLGCDRFDKDWCKECHCYLPEKIKWRSEDCPLQKWAKPTIKADSPPKSGGCGCGGVMPS